jgi:hypothetical protein
VHCGLQGRRGGGGCGWGWSGAGAHGPITGSASRPHASNAPSTHTARTRTQAYSGKTLLLGTALREATTYYLKAASASGVGGADLVRALKDKARTADTEIRAVKGKLSHNKNAARGDGMDIDDDDKENGGASSGAGGEGADCDSAASEPADALAASEGERATLRDFAIKLHMKNSALYFQGTAMSTSELARRSARKGGRESVGRQTRVRLWPGRTSRC